VPVEEPSTASQADIVALTLFVKGLLYEQ